MRKQNVLTQPVDILNPDGASSVVLACEHASNTIPAELGDLGLSQEVRLSHAAWDPGAMPVATRLSEHLDASLVAARFSRLVYDCNRPPGALDAMPARSEIFDIPGNANLSPADRVARLDAYYKPFNAALGEQIRQTNHPILVTIHSFTRVYNGAERATELGVLFDQDTRIADAMLSTASEHTSHLVEANEPYGPSHGVMHTVEEHALPFGYPNVMLEIRNDLIKTQAQQEEMAKMIAGWLVAAVAKAGIRGQVTCLA